MLVTDFDSTMGYYEELGSLCPDELLMPVDYSERMSQNISMTVRAYEMFVKLCKKRDVIVITTRSKQELDRLKFSNILPYAVHSNGAVIQIDGQEDMDWTILKDTQLKQTSVRVAECIRVFQSKYETYIDNVRITYNSLGTPLYPNIRFKDNHIPSLTELSSFMKSAGLEEFVLSMTGNKVYIIPACLNKLQGLQHLQAKLQFDTYIGAGDAIDDYLFLKDARIAMVSGYGALYQPQNQDLIDQLHNRVIFVGRGVQTSEQMLVHYNIHK
jgi:hydroxymethylpyrimidine pyrophosphatase-like HAD family hydrolase